MPDVLTPEQRSKTMSRIRSVDTKPEMTVRRMLHALGYRYRLHVRDLPGTPDIVFTSRHKVVFVNGCFWHSHSCRWGQSTPASNVDFWANKRSITLARDLRNREDLATRGWRVHTVWECELRDSEKLESTLIAFLES
ncbi:DNA mismatch endonuclease Vsr [Cryobacterium sp. TMT1-2-1]|uniref:very short patch repair endonuclease n=1 Tax=Cryobacterium sp. TMT1-2-1 TaxID=1259232 RepID=UPI00106CDFE6|nr:very short patch repair endonuclease [Cryobacterium sp. TMT1-2-1]TFD46649.1 DNA mismatch endonuclease Vsr [Cryobacterium sp. TMT1-2-1]